MKAYINIRNHKNEQGLSMLEYAVAAAALLGSVAAAMGALGIGLEGMFQAIVTYASGQTASM